MTFQLDTIKNIIHTTSIRIAKCFSFFFHSVFFRGKSAIIQECIFGLHRCAFIWLFEPFTLFDGLNMASLLRAPCADEIRKTIFPSTNLLKVTKLQDWRCFVAWPLNLNAICGNCSRWQGDKLHNWIVWLKFHFLLIFHLELSWPYVLECKLTNLCWVD